VRLDLGSVDEKIEREWASFFHHSVGKNHAAQAMNRAWIEARASQRCWELSFCVPWETVAGKSVKDSLSVEIPFFGGHVVGKVMAVRGMATVEGAWAWIRLGVCEGNEAWPELKETEDWGKRPDSIEDDPLWMPKVQVFHEGLVQKKMLEDHGGEELVPVTRIDMALKDLRPQGPVLEHKIVIPEVRLGL
jgi:hypothetical protein